MGHQSSLHAMMISSIMDMAVIIPAILDPECLSSCLGSVRKNIVRSSSDLRFSIIVHLDPYLRKGYDQRNIGKARIIGRCLKLIRDHFPDARIIMPKRRVGLKAAMISLLHDAVVRADWIIVIEDDSRVTAPVPLKMLIGLIPPVRLSFYAEDKDKGWSTETPFLGRGRTRASWQGIRYMLVVARTPYLSQNGIILPREWASQWANAIENSENEEPENVLIPWEDRLPTVVFRDRGVKKKENHILVDGIRLARDKKRFGFRG